MLGDASPSMRTHLEFKCDFFQPVACEEDETNPGIFGKQLAHWLAEQFSELGYDNCQVVAEDWGWRVSLSEGPPKLWLGCGSYEGDRWLVFIEPSKPYVRRWFRKMNVEQPVAKVAGLLEQMLNDVDASSMRWWADDEIG